MIDPYFQLITSIGVIILLVILFIVLPILILLRRQQRYNKESLAKLADAIEDFNKNITVMDGNINSNFKEIFAKKLVTDTKHESVKTAIETLGKGMDIYHTKTLDAIGFIRKTANRGRRRNKTPKVGNNPAA